MTTPYVRVRAGKFLILQATQATMFAQAHHPDTLDPEELDGYLERGWFRMGQTIFTTNYLNFKSQFYSAIWLRIELHKFLANSTQRKLFKQNSIFRIETQPATITPEKEALFARYKQGITFEASASLDHLMFGRDVFSVFNTYEICVYDGDKLIATGFFDIGAKSAAGITSFYDPDYKKYSLGKYLIYRKIEYCKNLALEYFYPGYFVPGYSFFDYKLTIGKPTLQYLQLISQQWLPIANFTLNEVPLHQMHDKLTAALGLLIQSRIPAKLLKYEFFDANLIPDLRGAGLFDFPLFIVLTESELFAENMSIVYDVRDQRYHLLRCKGVWKTNSMNPSHELYSSFLLKIEEDLFATDAPEKLLTPVLNGSGIHKITTLS